MNQVFILIIVLLLGVIILMAAHFLVFKFIVQFFNLTGSFNKKILAIILLSLFLSFFISSFIAHWNENLFTKAFYFMSGLWLGILVNLLLAIVLSWLLTIGIKLLGYHPNLLIIGIISFALAFIYSGYGVWNAFNPVVKNIEVEIKNLSENWKNKTIVQLSDLHLGYVHRAGFLEDVVKKTNDIEPDLVVITGDLFDGMDGDFNSFLEPLDNIRAKKGVFFVTGNHETYFGVREALAILSKTKIKVLNDQIVNIDGLEIIGISYPMMGEKKDIKNVILSKKEFNKELPSILLYHSPINIGQVKESGETAQLRTHWFINKAQAAAEEIGINIQLSGHTHEGQIFPLGYISKLVYGGYDYGLHKQGDFSIYITSGVGTWGPAMRTGNRPEIVAIKLK